MCPETVKKEVSNKKCINETGIKMNCLRFNVFDCQEVKLFRYEPFYFSLIFLLFANLLLKLGKCYFKVFVCVFAVF